MKKKRILIVLIVVLVGIVGVFLTLSLLKIHNTIITNRPDSSDWVLSNDTYTVVPQIDDSVSFVVVDQEGDVVYFCAESWRSWDFKSLSIGEDNTIIVNSSDTGKEVYRFQNGTWIRESKANE